LTGSVKQTEAGTWLASVPETRGSRRRVERTFATEMAARAWVDAAVAVLMAGGTVVADEIVATVATVADTADGPAVESVSAALEASTTDSSWFATLCEEYHWNEYMISQNALPDRAATTQQQLRKIIVPFFATRWSGPDRGLQKLAELVGGPGLGFVFGDGPQPRCVGDRGNVAGQDPSFDRGGECAADDEVDLKHRLRGERFHTRFGGAKLRVVEPFEVGDLESSDRDPAEGREDVPFDLAAVAVPGRLGERVGFAGEPLLGEVGAEGE
jgi:hypothetical protein